MLVVSITIFILGLNGDTAYLPVIAESTGKAYLLLWLMKITIPIIHRPSFPEESCLIARECLLLAPVITKGGFHPEHVCHKGTEAGLRPDAYIQVIAVMTIVGYHLVDFSHNIGYRLCRIPHTLCPGIGEIDMIDRCILFVLGSMIDEVIAETICATGIFRLSKKIRIIALKVCLCLLPGLIVGTDMRERQFIGNPLVISIKIVDVCQSGGFCCQQSVGYVLRSPFTAEFCLLVVVQIIDVIIGPYPLLVGEAHTKSPCLITLVCPYAGFYISHPVGSVFLLQAHVHHKRVIAHIAPHHR